MAVTLDFTMFQGDTKIIELTVKDQDGAVVDITGVTMKYKVAKNAKSTGDNIFIEKETGDGITIIDPVAGRANIQFDPIDTLDLGEAVYYHEAEITDSGIISTVLASHFKILNALID